MDLPTSRRWILHSARGRAWAAALLDLVARAIRDRNLELGKPFDGGAASCVCQGWHEGNSVVLKIQFPDRDRALGWAFAQTIAWSFDSAHTERHYETIRWLLEAR